jgi:hypothetical protein
LKQPIHCSGWREIGSKTLCSGTDPINQSPQLQGNRTSEYLALQPFSAHQSPPEQLSLLGQLFTSCLQPAKIIPNASAIPTITANKFFFIVALLRLRFFSPARDSKYPSNIQKAIPEIYTNKAYKMNFV